MTQPAEILTDECGVETQSSWVTRNMAREKSRSKAYLDGLVMIVRTVMRNHGASKLVMDRVENAMRAWQPEGK